MQRATLKIWIARYNFFNRWYYTNRVMIYWNTNDKLFNRINGGLMSIEYTIQLIIDVNFNKIAIKYKTDMSFWRKWI